MWARRYSRSLWHRERWSLCWGWKCWSAVSSDPGFTTTDGVPTRKGATAGCNMLLVQPGPQRDARCASVRTGAGWSRPSAAAPEAHLDVRLIVWGARSEVWVADQR